MVSTVALAIVIMLTALAVVLYAAYCEAGEDLPCKKAHKKAQKKARVRSADVAKTSHAKGSS